MANLATSTMNQPHCMVLFYRLLAGDPTYFTGLANTSPTNYAIKYSLTFGSQS